MLARYNKTGSIRGTAAFERYLKNEGEGGGDIEVDYTIPVEEEKGGAFGARQAIIMGVPESAMNAQGPKGLGTLGNEYDYFPEQKARY